MLNNTVLNEMIVSRDVRKGWLMMRETKNEFTRHPVLWVLLMLAILFTIIVYLDNVLIRVTQYTVKSEKIPDEFGGYKIVQLSDIHGQKFGENNDVLIRKVREAEPDIILVTGDVVNNAEDDAIQVFEHILDGIEDIAPVYAVTGNHDQWDDDFAELIEKWQNEYNITYLENKTMPLERDGAVINLSGISDPGIWYGEECDALVEQYRNEMQLQEGYQILMFHRADMLDDFIGTPYDLIFSGHLHGGQWRIPFAGGVISPDMKLFPDYSGGRYDTENQTFIVSRGIGNPQTFSSFTVPRIFKMAEIVEVTLEKAGH